MVEWELDDLTISNISVILFKMINISFVCGVGRLSHNNGFGYCYPVFC